MKCFNTVPTLTLKHLITSFLCSQAEADPYLVYGLPVVTVELNCKNAWGWPVPCAQEGEAKKKREAEAKPYYGYGYGLPVVSVKTVELEAGKVS